MKIQLIIFLVILGLILFFKWIKKKPYEAMKILSQTKVNDKKSVNNSISEIVETFIPSVSSTSSSSSSMSHTVTDILQKLMPSSLNDDESKE